MNKKFFEIRNKTETSADLLIYGDIVSSKNSFFSSDDNKCPQDIVDFLSDAQGRDLNIYINSCGGNVFAGMAIYNQLKRYSGKKTVYVDGLAGSIASVIALCGDELRIPANAFLMIHKPFMGIIGNSPELRKAAEDLDRIEEGIVNVYAENLKEGVEIDKIKEMMNEETWLNGEAAAEIFNCIVTEELKAVAYCDISSDLSHIPEEITNKTSANIQALEDARIKLSSLNERIKNYGKKS